MNAILKFILETATTKDVKEAVKSYNVTSLAYKMSLSIQSQFGIKSGTTSFGIAVSDAFDGFKTDCILLAEVNAQINKLQSRLKVMSRFHPEYLNLCLEYDALVSINNKLSEPITAFLKMYKKAQKGKGNNISVVKKREPRINKPA